MRHLSLALAIGALRRGKSIEQFLGRAECPGERGIRWASIDPAAAMLEVTLFERADIGDDTFLDLVNLPSLGEQHTESSDGRHEAAELDGWIVGTATSADDALAPADSMLGTHPDRWVNFGVVGDEYRDYLHAGRRWPPRGLRLQDSQRHGC